MKKQILNLLVLAVLICFAGSSYGQSDKVIKEEKIKTGFHCPNGKALLEKELMKVDGVTGVVADMDSKVVAIKYVDGKTNREKLVKAIETIGYTTEDTSPTTTIKKACSHDQPQKE
ncbi:MAG TPA: heavy-metal-associated domain-containing protein [Bacteroidales bacterium]|nr:heavy-metal-associated domain-containing protein [Bacteroidales bacterium]HPS27925.1 heavy-metal-associated domain-containing protein [Bacteroidales bacterium]